MKKIPTLFARTFINSELAEMRDETNKDMDCILKGEGVATVKFDGSCTMVKGGKLYKRYDAKNGKTPPEGAVPCCDSDPVTGHWPHWLLCSSGKPEDKWLLDAFSNAIDDGVLDVNTDEGTYEAIGPHFQANPYCLPYDTLVKHGTVVVRDLVRTYEGIHEFLKNNLVEGIVFWRNGEPCCKIRRRDYGLAWPPHVPLNPIAIDSDTGSEGSYAYSLGQGEDMCPPNTRWCNSPKDCTKCWKCWLHIATKYNEESGMYASLK